IAVKIGRRIDRPSIYSENIIAFGNIDSRSAERRTQFRIPAFTGIDMLDPKFSVRGLDIRTEHSDRYRIIHRNISVALKIRMADRQFAAYLCDQIAEIRAMADVF